VASRLVHHNSTYKTKSCIEIGRLHYEVKSIKVSTMSEFEETGCYDRLITYDKGVLSKIRKKPKEMAPTIYKKVSGYHFRFIRD